MKKKILLIMLLIFMVFMIFTLSINIYMIKTTDKQIVSIDELDDSLNVDAIIVLGCRVYDDIPSLMLLKRMEKAKEVYDILKTKLLLSGDHENDNYDEIKVMSNYFNSENIASDNLMEDRYGISTYDSIYRAKNVYHLRKVIIVTQKFHMNRALYIANSLDLDAVGVVALDIPQKIVMLKNELREILSRDKNFFKVYFHSQSKYLNN